ncbi:MAG: hypothetical protein IPM99_17480 [Rubrivivax sp.]|nr:hypothetical protein [Rubrivivax sp.]
MTTIHGNAYSESLTGTSGDDTIDGAGGSDFIDGGAGTDTAIFFDDAANFSITTLSGVTRLYGLAGATDRYRDDEVFLTNVEKLQFNNATLGVPASPNNLIIKNGYSETITGTSGNDTIDGAGGSDFIDGGAGTDTAIFFDDAANFSITTLSGVTRLYGLAGATDRYWYDEVFLTNVEKLQFSDRTITLGLDATSYSISPASSVITEGSPPASFVVSRPSDRLASEETVFISTTQVHGSSNQGDYVGLLNQQLTFKVGEADQSVDVTILNDGSTEADETFGLIVQTKSTDPVSTVLAAATFTIQDKSIESTSVALPKINGNILVELAKLSAVAYKADVLNLPDHLKIDWKPLTANMLAAAGFDDISGLNGHIQTVPVLDVFESRAHAYVGEVDGKPTVVLAFAGSEELNNETWSDSKMAEILSQVGRWGDYFDAHLKFVNSVVNWSNSQGYQLLVTGHSLGGIITEITAKSLEDTETAENAYFVTFGSPGSPADAGTYVDRILNFVRTNDPVPRTDGLANSREGTTVSIIPDLTPAVIGSSHSMAEKYLPSVEGYVEKFSSSLGKGLDPIISSIKNGNTLAPILDGGLDSGISPYPDWLILSAYYTSIGPANLIIDSGLGALSATQYVGVTLAEFAETSGEALATGIEFLGKAAFDEAVAAGSFARTLTSAGLEKGQSIIVGGLQRVSIALGKGSIIVLVDEDVDGKFDSKIVVEGDYDLDLVQARITDIGLQISYGDPPPPWQERNCRNICGRVSRRHERTRHYSGRWRQ